MSVAAWILAAVPVAPAGAAPATAPLDAEALVARAILARGGLARWRAVRAVRVTGKLRVGEGGDTLELAMAWVHARPGLLRHEITMQGLTDVTAWDGREGWQMSPFGGRRDAQRLSADDAKGLAVEADLEGALVDYRQKGHRVTSLGTEDVDGTPAYKLEVALGNGDTEYVYLDPDTFLEIRRISVHRVRGVENVSQSDYGEYQDVGGLRIPFSIASGAKGRPPGSTIQVERVEIDPPVDATLFRFPRPGERVERAVVAGPPGTAPLPTTPAAPAAGPMRFDAGVISGLGARNIGSAAMSGRIAAVAALDQGGKTLLYVGAASGGVWKSIDGGTTMRPVFDREAVQSVGAIAIDPSRPATVWVGTGEGWTRNSTSIGDGIYKTTDGGETWTRMGLPDAERITKIVVHPKNGDVVYACVPGRLWSDSTDRGLYKTGDGGKTWALVLPGGNPSTGCSGVSLDPGNPEVVFAGLWDFRRKGWTFRSGGEGPDAPSGSGLRRSADGGRTWAVLDGKSAPGLPAGPWGRVEVVVAPSNPKIVYAFIESKDSALYRSDDGGRTWQARDKSTPMVWRPFYFARLVVDPTNPERLFKPDGALVVSEDGGRSFAFSGGGSHGDWHDLWIDPKSPKHVIGGDDGGLWISRDGGSRWWKVDNLPVSQFYHVAVDDRDPYKVYGGLQDNGSWVADSSYPGGITQQRWEAIYGGDGFWAIPDPRDPDTVYAESQGGYLARIDRRTGVARDIQPKAAYHEKLRFNWNAPIHVSPTQRGVLYLGAQVLFRSKDRGDSWERISPDLTSNDPAKQKQEESGGVTVDNSAAEMHTTIFSVSESPRDAKLIWVGTDDGKVQLTRDGGKSWTDLTKNVTGLPPASWVNWIEASGHDKATALAAFDRHTFGDFAPWVYRTTDFGKTWTRIAGPAEGVRGWAHVIKEDPVLQRVLYLGTELGLWISIDGGARWAAFKGGDFPAVAVRDLQVHRRDHDLVLGTHGRGIWIIDDVSPLRALSDEVLGKDAALLPGRPVQQRMPATGGWVEGDARFVGENPPGAAVVTYYQKARPLFGRSRLEILDPSGRVIDTIPASKRRGIARATWSMRTPPPRVPRAAQVAGSANLGPRLPPGTYGVRLVRGADVLTGSLEVRLDRRAPFGAVERKAHFDATMRVHALFGAMTDLGVRIDAVRGGALARAAAVGAHDALADALRGLAERADALRRKIVATKEGGAITGEERLREHADLLYGALASWEGKPAPYLLDRVAVLERELGDVRRDFEGLVGKELPGIDGALKGKGLAPIPTDGPAGEAAGGAGGALLDRLTGMSRRLSR